MGWEIWTTQLDEEELVVNGEFVTQTEVLIQLYCLIKCVLCCQAVVNESLKMQLWFEEMQKCYAFSTLTAAALCPCLCVLFELF